MHSRGAGHAVWIAAVLIAVGLSACAAPEPPRESALVLERSRPAYAPATGVTKKPARPGQVIARNDRFLIYLPAAGDTFASIATQFLGSEDRAWMITDFNEMAEVKPGQPLVVPLQSINPTGVSPNGYQTIPILCYHRFGSDEGKMVLSPAAFAQQMEYLHRNGYRVLRLSDLYSFLGGARQLPARAVVLTIDDGYNSMYHQAYPVLKRYGFPATVFVYTDFIGARDSLTWDQMKEMVASGLIDVQAHSKTHTNLTLRQPGESDNKYRERLSTEAATPQDIIQRKLHVNVSSYAYPYGDANGIMLEQLTKSNYRMGLTVDPGGNAFFTPPLLLRRTMILGDQDLEAFKAQLQVFKTVDLH